jgi:hypothetical protein
MLDCLDLMASAGCWLPSKQGPCQIQRAAIFEAFSGFYDEAGDAMDENTAPHLSIK